MHSLLGIENSIHLVKVVTYVEKQMICAVKEIKTCVVEFSSHTLVVWEKGTERGSVICVVCVSAALGAWAKVTYDVWAKVTYDVRAKVTYAAWVELFASKGMVTFAVLQVMVISDDALEKVIHVFL